jgi:hypothetical protein
VLAEHPDQRLGWSSDVEVRQRDDGKRERIVRGKGTVPILVGCVRRRRECRGSVAIRRRSWVC